MMNYEDEEDIIFKINYLVKNSSRLFQLIILEDNDTSYVPKFNFNYMLIDCNENENLTRGTEWEKILESSIPVVFINTASMFVQFNKENKKLNGKEVNGAALFAQGFYYTYRDKFWEDNKSKLIFMVTEEDVQAMWEYVNAGFTIELIPYYLRRNKKEKEENKQVLVKISNNNKKGLI